MSNFHLKDFILGATYQERLLAMVGVNLHLTAGRHGKDKKAFAFVCLNDFPVKETRQTPTKGYKRQAGNSQSPSQTLV